MKSNYPIFIADSNEALLDGLVSIISQEPAFEVVGTARSAKEMAGMALTCAPALYLVDMDLAYMNDPGLLVSIADCTDDSKIIILTEHWENSLIKRIMAAGVMGCLRKSCDASELIYAIHSVLDGKPYFSGYLEEEFNISAKEKKHK